MKFAYATNISAPGFQKLRPDQINLLLHRLPGLTTWSLRNYVSRLASWSTVLLVLGRFLNCFRQDLIAL